MSNPSIGNELICRFRPAPNTIQLASQIKHSSDITSARVDSPAEACDPFSWKPFHIYGRPRTIIHIQSPRLMNNYPSVP
ncbi:hypothetical protein AHAS_Ahas19G0186500 [Arachis hypogaea]